MKKLRIMLCALAAIGFVHAQESEETYSAHRRKNKRQYRAHTRQRWYDRWEYECQQREEIKRQKQQSKKLKTTEQEIY